MEIRPLFDVQVVETSKTAEIIPKFPNKAKLWVLKAGNTAFQFSSLMASKGYFSSLTKEQEDNALLNKLAVPEGSYNRLSALLSRLAQTTSPDELYGLPLPKLIIRTTLQAELEDEFVNFELATIKAQNIRNVNEKEEQRYNAEKEIIRNIQFLRTVLIIVEKSYQAQQDITSLREELREAKLERGQKVQYDELTRAMLKKTPKSRTEQVTYPPIPNRLLTLVQLIKLPANWRKWKTNCRHTQQFGMHGNEHSIIY